MGFVRNTMIDQYVTVTAPVIPDCVIAPVIPHRDCVLLLNVFASITAWFIRDRLRAAITMKLFSRLKAIQHLLSIAGRSLNENQYMHRRMSIKDWDSELLV